jgi:hypothetical protein
MTISKENSNLIYAMVDLLSGDSSAYSSTIKDFDLDKIKIAVDYILNNPKLTDSQKTDLLLNNWRVHYKQKPPTPEEFLTHKYIGRMADDIYPRIKTAFIDFFDDTKPHRDAIFFPHIGWGKSTLSVLCNLYTTTHLSLMRDPKKFFGLATSTVLANVLCSFSLKKSAELLLEPFMNILDGSEFFAKVRTREDMIKIEEEYSHQDEGMDRVFWTTASLQGTSAMTFMNGINYKLVSNKNNLLGLSIVNGTMTELGFFRDAGKSDAYIMEFFNNLKMRIYSRMKKTPFGRYWGRSILDSSPNDIDSPIDKYIIFDAPKDPRNYIIKGSVWDWAPEEYNMEDTFSVYKGGNGKPPTILNNSLGYNPDDIIQVPRELYTFFQDDLRKALKDLAGLPSGSLDKLFYDHAKIEKAFIPALKNINLCIRADATMPPKGLIWNQVKDTLFVKNVSGKYIFYYKPQLPRVIHIDQSISNDMSGIAVVHVERRKEEFSDDLSKDIVYVVDFVIPIHPFGGRINLESIKDFIVDLAAQGNLPIVGVSFDTYQSEANIQALARMGFNTDTISVDKSLDPYMYLSQLIEQGNLKIGRSIYFKNNLKSLRIVPRDSGSFKVDHTLGETPTPMNSYDENWGSSLLGINAKDVSDAVAGAVYNAKKILAVSPMGLRELWDETKIFSSPEAASESLKDTLKILGVKMPFMSREALPLQ